jgi:hypothetical protein
MAVRRYSDAGWIRREGLDASTNRTAVDMRRVGGTNQETIGRGRFDSILPKPQTDAD